MLANAINIPLVAAAGLVVFTPLILTEAAIEWAALRLTLSTRAPGLFRRLIWVNVVSSLAGLLVYACQDLVVEWSGIEASVPAFARGYRWVAPVLVAIYLAKSLLIEVPMVANRRWSAALNRRRAQLARGVVIGNLASYCVVGPLFYWSTRPNFRGFDLRDDTTWTTNPDVPVYFIDPANDHIKRVNTDGTGVTTVVAFRADAFLVSEDGTAFVFRAMDNSIYALRQRDEAPIRVRAGDPPPNMDAVSLSPCHRWVAFAMDGDSEVQELRIQDLDSGAQHHVQHVPLDRYEARVSWSRDGSVILAEQDLGRFVVIRGGPPWDAIGQRLTKDTDSREWPINYSRSGREPDVSPDRMDGIEVRCQLGFGSHISVWRGQRQKSFTIADGYGLLDLGRSYPTAPAFLPNGNEFLVEWWGQIYLFDIKARRLGLLTHGRHYVAPLPGFRIVDVGRR